MIPNLARVCTNFLQRVNQSSLFLEINPIFLILRNERSVKNVQSIDKPGKQ
jgi:hypothetical protein